MSKKTKYRMITSESDDLRYTSTYWFNARMEEAIEDGFEPYGEPFSCQNKICQAVIKRNV